MKIIKNTYLTGSWHVLTTLIGKMSCKSSWNRLNAQYPLALIKTATAFPYNCPLTLGKIRNLNNGYIF